MTSLPRPIRRDLENAVVAARRLAETGAREALDALAVGERTPFGHLTREQTTLRNRLRAHGRALGDRKAASGAQTLDNLAHAVAYEHWHRMLFARFLAENGCLLEPESGVAVSLTDVEGLAREEGADVWELAGGYAERMLPQIFRSGDPALAVQLPRETRVKLERLLADLPATVFTAADSLGWVYQFWQSEAKEAANRSGEKIDANTLPAVTQLFTEDYMVDFLLQNALAPHAARWLLQAEQPLRFASETAAREALSLPKSDSLPGLGWTYLRLATDPEDSSSFLLHPSSSCPSLAEFKLLDPSMGSGHFLVFALPLLARLRMEVEGLSVPEALRAVLRDNLHGLELDERCGQLAAFNLALAAWRLCPELQTDGEGLPPLNLALCGRAPFGTREDWLRIIEGRGQSEMRFFMGALFDHFQKAPTLGSLIHPEKLLGGLFDPDRLEALYEAIDDALDETHPDFGERYETGVVAQGLAKAVTLLSGRYDLVTTNVPYLARGKQGDALRDYIERVYPAGKADLATAFVLRCREFLKPGGSTALVTPQNWLFLKSYDKLREMLLRQLQWDCVARLGEHGFESAAAAGAFTALLTLTRQDPSPEHRLLGLDVSAEKSPEAKADSLLTTAVHAVGQAQQLDNPDARVSIEEGSDLPLLDHKTSNHQGLSTGDNPRFRRVFSEVREFGEEWEGEQSTVNETGYYGGRSGIILWEQGSGQLYKFGRENVEALHNVDRRGEEAWDKIGVAVSQMRSLPTTIYRGQKFDTNVAVLIPSDPAHLPAIWCFCSSPEYNEEVRKIDQKLNVTNATLAKVPFDLERWSKVAAERYHDGLPEPYSPDPTQWLFKGRVDDATDPLQVAVARLLGYRWPAETDPDKAGVALFDSDRRHWEALAPHIDDDGIIPLTALRGEAPAAERLQRLLHAAFEAARAHPYQLPANWRDDEIPAAPRPLDFPTAEAWIDHLLRKEGARDLGLYLRDHFFDLHCKRFQHRPFIWHIWDGRPDGFHALVNYHRLAAPDGAGRALLENLTYSYLRDWILRQRDEVAKGEPGAQDRLEASEALQQELIRILAGEPPYDLFIRWKPLHEQPIGWYPDINDGVRLNIRPFLKARDMKNKDAGLLRFKPNIKWGKDRGKEPLRPSEDHPWFWGWDEKTQDFQGARDHDGNRWNDCHYTPATKQAARKRKESEA